MLLSSIPTRLPIPFANAGTKNSIPVASQIGVTGGAASLTDGFPPLTFIPLASGGIPPFGADVNGVLYEVSGWAVWLAAGAPVTWDSAFSAAIGGYPKGALLYSTLGNFRWLSTVDSNVVNPDAGALVTASISGTVLTVLSVVAGTVAVGQAVAGTGVPGGLTIASNGTGVGGVGTYNLNSSGGTVTIEPIQLGAVGWSAIGPFGQLSGMGIGAGLYDDGNGNLAAAGGSGTYVNTSQSIPPGDYLVDTSGGAITLTASSPTPVLGQGYSFTDARKSFGLNACTFAGNGKLVGNPELGVTGSTLTMNISGVKVAAWYNGTIYEVV